MRSCSATRDPRRDNGSRSVRGRQSANQRIPGGLVSSEQGKRFAAGQVGAANAAAGSNSCCLICLPATLVRLPATYGSSQCRGQRHSPDPSRLACRRHGFRAWNIAEHAWSLARIEGCARAAACLDRYQPAVADVDPAWSAGVWWFTPRAQVCLLQQQLSDASGDGHHQVVTPPRGWPRDSPPGVRAPGRPSHPLGPSRTSARPTPP
jgi:hypothetical protein